ncbi:UNVERIFIED_CONTAM: hypothetical protein Scaly_1492200 [Sesamum calycinum]|uniref:Reverse transcriptase domain-containing protein n=1 Tax=Sesamum calycinum TaxID=2727403 RepID=A0AAW2PPB7_9LAMI
MFPEEIDSEHLDNGLTDEDRRSLCAMPTLEEVRKAVFNIDPDVVWRWVWGSFTATTISLISKTANPTCWSKYRPISLCNVMNKICTKLMTLRLWHVLPKVISLSQSGFVPGRLLSDNVLLAQELVHSLESRGPEVNVVFKLDMAKAYDRVSWEFLYEVLRRKGFPQRWIGLVANAVSHCWFSVLVNGSVSFWHDNWLGEKPLAQLLHKDTYTMEPVSYYWHEGDWNVPRILRTILMSFAQTICQILIAAGHGDKIVWTGSSAGDFSTKLEWEAIR